MVPERGCSLACTADRRRPYRCFRGLSPTRWPSDPAFEGEDLIVCDGPSARQAFQKKDGDTAVKDAPPSEGDRGEKGRRQGQAGLPGPRSLVATKRWPRWTTSANRMDGCRGSLFTSTPPIDQPQGASTRRRVISSSRLHAPNWPFDCTRTTSVCTPTSAG